MLLPIIEAVALQVGNAVRLAVSLELGTCPHPLHGSKTRSDGSTSRQAAPAAAIAAGAFGRA